eukprot:CAMPEP_0114999158 /NCGR_PEP_ID=MMETSP0216-20121206/15976_1 /TAXON_ID=223996 /ORGANISM="Protocruzia adherens, Strain Boccale" /LENGTH=485 /DNA_ID=CAMNT_0002363973 /DNA_START=21 /DNA_END=1475 /DNA_ORIENTATION=-
MDGDIDPKLKEIWNRPENQRCADCPAKKTRYVSLKLGIFLCGECRAVHETLGRHVSTIISINDLRGNDTLFQNLAAKGNERVRDFYEFNRPSWYITAAECPDITVVRENWIKAKYVCKKFVKKGSKFTVEPTTTQSTMATVEDGADDNSDDYDENGDARMDKHWWYIDEKSSQISRRGPFLLREFCSEVSSGAISEETFCWHPHLKDWEELRKIPKLLEMMLKGPDSSTLNRLITRTSSLEESSPGDVVVYDGYLMKQSKKTPSKWQKRWVSISYSSDYPELRYYFKKGDETPRGEISLEGCSISVITPTMRPHGQIGFEFATFERSFVFSTDNPTEVLEWALSLRNLQYVLHKFDNAHTREFKKLEMSEKLEEHYSAIRGPSLAQGIIKKGKKKLGMWSMKKRYFILRDALITYYEPDDSTRHHPLGTINLREARVMKGHDQKNPHYFTIDAQDEKGPRTFHLWAESDDARETWISKIKYVCGE